MALCFVYCGDASLSLGQRSGENGKLFPENWFPVAFFKTKECLMAEKGRETHTGWKIKINGWHDSKGFFKKLEIQTFSWAVLSVIQVVCVRVFKSLPKRHLPTSRVWQRRWRSLRQRARLPRRPPAPPWENNSPTEMTAAGKHCLRVLQKCVKWLPRRYGRKQMRIRRF